LVARLAMLEEAGEHHLYPLHIHQTRQNKSVSGKKNMVGKKFIIGSSRCFLLAIHRQAVLSATQTQVTWLALKR
jgi:hypothetical protein